MESKERNRQDAARLPQLSCNGGLERWTENPVALEGCLVLLEELRDSIAEVGFVAEFDKKILTKLYGSYDDYRENWRKTLFDSYLAWLRTSLASAERREQHGYATPEECRQNFVEEADQEIRLVIVVHAHVLVLDRQAQVVVAGVPLHEVAGIQQPGGVPLPPGMQDDGVDVALFRLHHRSRADEIYPRRAADGSVAIQDRQ